MTNEELALMVQNGQTEAVLPLWQRVEKFVRKSATRWSYAWTSRGISSEDLYQSGFIAMMEATETFDPDKAKFITWLGYYLRKVFSDLVGIRTKQSNLDPINHAASLDAPLVDGEEATLEDVTPDPADYIGEADRRIYLEQLHKELEWALSTLPEEESQVLRLRFYSGLPRKDTAKIGGITPEEARKRESKALQKLRQGKQAARLRAFVDERTPFYSAYGVHATEWVVLKRERIANSHFEQNSR